MTKGGHLRMFAAVAVIVVLAYACDDRASIDSGGSLASEEGLIVFTRATRFAPPDFESDLYAISVDGTGERRLTDSPGLDAFPAWSLDGTRIAFTSEGLEEHSRIFVMNADGSGLTRLTDGPADDAFPAWQP
jgi:dipeptidyl aminopeptidase/acylaminoacyl peptidase